MHEAARDAAIRLIKKNGRLVTFQKLAAGPDDPDMPWRGEGEPVVASSVNGVYGCFVFPTGTDLGRGANIAGIGFSVSDTELMKRTSQIMLAQPSVPDLENMHRVVDQNTIWKILWSQKLIPADTNVLYIFGLMR